MNDSLLVRVSNLSKTFKHKGKEDICALKNISLSLKRGEIAALVGPDGAGKTTFLRLLCGLMVPDGFAGAGYTGLAACNADGGCISIDGFSPVSNLGEVKKIIGYMPQKFGLYEDLTVLENLKLYAVLNGRDGAASNKSVEGLTADLLNFAGLSEFKNRLAGKLSGGMKQKLGLCCTLISKPLLLLLDEPSVGVDPISRRELMKIVEKLVKSSGMSAIWSTSYLDEAQNFERVYLFNEGEKIYDGSPKSAANSMKGLVYHVKKEGVSIHTFLKEVVNMQEKARKPLADALIEGDKLRVVFKNAEWAKEFSLPKAETSPIFEDFVIYTLKSLNKRVLEGNKSYNNLIEGVLDVKNTENAVTIKAVGLTKKYGSFTAADNISFEIKKGEIFGLLGPNGAGKSTTFKMLCGLIRPNSGYCSIMGVKLSENPTLARSFLGYTAQKFSLFGNLSVVQNLSFFAGVYGLHGAKKANRVQNLLEFFDLLKYSDTNAEALPLGYKQRLALACSTVHTPKVLFLDEPTSGVDPISRREFWSQISSLAESGTTVLITTHFMDEAQYCDRISLIYRGKSLITATPDELKNLVKSEFNTSPTMEDAFIELISRENKEALEVQK